MKSPCAAGIGIVLLFTSFSAAQPPAEAPGEWLAALEKEGLPLPPGLDPTSNELPRILSEPKTLEEMRSARALILARKLAYGLKHFRFFKETRGAQMDYLKAVLGMQLSNADRIKLIERGVTDAEAFRELARKRVGAGIDPPHELVDAQVHALDWRIMLASEKERMSAETKAEVPSAEALAQQLTVAPKDWLASLEKHELSLPPGVDPKSTETRRIYDAPQTIEEMRLARALHLAEKVVSSFALADNDYFDARMQYSKAVLELALYDADRLNFIEGGVKAAEALRIVVDKMSPAILVPDGGFAEAVALEWKIMIAVEKERSAVLKNAESPIAQAVAREFTVVPGGRVKSDFTEEEIPLPMSVNPSPNERLPFYDDLKTIEEMRIARVQRLAEATNRNLQNLFVIGVALPYVDMLHTQYVNAVLELPLSDADRLKVIEGCIKTSESLHTRAEKEIVGGIALPAEACDLQVRVLDWKIMLAMEKERIGAAKK